MVWIYFIIFNNMVVDYWGNCDDTITPNEIVWGDTGGLLLKTISQMKDSSKLVNK
jgi:hypothetical protein